MDCFVNYEYCKQYLCCIQDLIHLLNSNPNNIILAKEEEKSLDEYDFSSLLSQFTSNTIKKQVDNVLPPPLPLPLPLQQAQEKSLGNLCTTCPERISYKANQFEKKKIRYPFLILIYNSVHSKKNQFFEDGQKDILFKKIIDNTFHVSADSFLIRDAIRCHFHQDIISRKKEFYQNCISNIKKDIEEYSIKGILCFGKNVVNIMFDSTIIHNKTSKVFDFLGLPTVISPGIDDLFQLQNSHSSREKILQEKKKIFFTLKLFQNEVLQWK